MKGGLTIINKSSKYSIAHLFFFFEKKDVLAGKEKVDFLYHLVPSIT